MEIADSLSIHYNAANRLMTDLIAVVLPPVSL